MPDMIVEDTLNFSSYLAATALMSSTAARARSSAWLMAWRGISDALNSLLRSDTFTISSAAYAYIRASSKNALDVTTLSQIEVERTISVISSSAARAVVTALDTRERSVRGESNEPVGSERESLHSAFIFGMKVI